MNLRQILTPLHCCATDLELVISASTIFPTRVRDGPEKNINYWATPADCGKGKFQLKDLLNKD